MTRRSCPMSRSAPGLEARLARPVYYQLVELGEERARRRPDPLRGVERRPLLRARRGGLRRRARPEAPMVTREELRHRLARAPGAPRRGARRRRGLAARRRSGAAALGGASARRTPAAVLIGGRRAAARTRGAAHPAHRPSARPCRPDQLPGRADRARRRLARRPRRCARPRRRSGSIRGQGRGAGRARPLRHGDRLSHPSGGRLDRAAVRAAARSLRGRRRVRGAAAVRGRPASTSAATATAVAR